MTSFLIVLVSTSLAQFPIVVESPHEKPPPLKPGYASYFVSLKDGSTLYGIDKARPKDARLPNTVVYKADVPNGASRTFKRDEISFWDIEAPKDRKTRWREKEWPKWYRDQGYRRATLVDGAETWILKTELELANQAREAAAEVNRRETPPKQPEAPPAVEDTPAEEVPEAGASSRWGSQIVLLLGALLIIAAIGKSMVFTGGKTEP